jgi:uncharacterized membrane protein
MSSSCGFRQRSAIFLLGFVLAIFGGWSTGQAQQSPQTLHSHLPAVVGSGQAVPVGSLPPEQNISFSIVLPLRNQSGLTSLLGQLYDPFSPNYRHFLSVQQFTEQFGPTAEDYQAVVSFARANGLTVTDTPANRLIVPITGSVAQINQAFNVTMRVYQHPTENRTFYSPDREPSLNLGARVAHITGLNNFSIPQPRLKRQTTSGQAIANVLGSGPGGSYLGSDMRAAYYGGTTLTGTGQAVGILEFGGYNLSDVNATFSNTGQTNNVPINNVLLDGATGAATGDDAEQVLDIVQAIGMAPGLSQVRVYIGSATVVDDASIFNSMATENIAKQISVSWGWVPDDPSIDDVFFQEFAAQGQTVFVASGDDGAFDAAISPFFYPGEDAYVTAVGATHLTTTGAGGTWVSETAWNSGGAGSGGGVSPDGISIPSWQAGAANTSNGASATLRNVPDIAMEGDFDNYVCSVGYGCGGGWAGTSFAAPRWAGFMALVNQQATEAGTAPMGGVGSINPQIYAIGAGSNYSSDLHDIAVGNNDTAAQPVWFNAVTGYDLVTGWGSANGQNLIDALAGPQVPGFWLASSSSNVSVPQGASSSTTIAVTDAGGFTGDVSLAVTSTLPTGVTASWGTNPTSGSSVLTLTATSSAPAATATVTITGTSGSMIVTTNVTVSVHPPSFIVSDSPVVLSINQGASGTTKITVTPQYGFSGNVSLAVTSALPTGVTASWGTNPTSGSSVLTLTASSSAPAAKVGLTITGTSGSLTASTTLNLTVYAPTFTLSASSQNIGLGTSGTSYIYVYPVDGFTGSVNLAVTGLPTGVTASFSPNPTSGSSMLTLTASSSATTGTSTLTVTGTSGATSATTTLTLGVFGPGFTLSTGNATIGQGTSGTFSVYVNPQYGFNGSINLAVTGLPSGVTASISPNPVTGTTTLTLNASSTAAIGTSTLTLTGTSGSLTASTTFSLGVFTPDFTLSDYATTTMGQGGSGTSYVYIGPEYGFTGSVSLAVTGLPSGVTASFSPNPTVGNSVMTLTASSTAALGTQALTITGTSGTLTHSTTTSVGVYAPAFTLSTSNLNIGLGSSGSTSVNVYSQYGFNGSVHLAVTGLPSGVTASFSPNPTTGSSVLTLTASSTAVAGTATVTITGTSGSLTASTTLTLGVSAPSFTLSANAAYVGQGSSATSYVYINPQYGFTGSVNLTATGLPSGLTASFSPNPTNGSSTLTLTASSTVTPGQYTATITGTSGSLTVSTVVNITVSVPSFGITAYSTTVGQGSTATSSIYVNSQNGFTGNVNFVVTGLPSGITASFSPNPTTYNSTLTLTAGSAVPVGQYTATITGTSGSLSASTTLNVSVAVPSFTLSTSSSISTGPGSAGTAYIYVYGQNGFSGSVHLAVTGLPSGVTASFAPNPTSPSTTSSLLTLTVSSTASVGTTPLTITGTSGSLTATTTLSLIVTAPSFTISDYTNMALGQGASAISYVSLNPQYGFTGSVNLTVTGLPSGVTASFSPNPISTSTGSSTLTLTASSTAALGQYNVTITGTSGSTTASTTVNVIVNAPTFGLSTSSLSVGQGASGTSYVYVNPQYGFSGSVHLAVTGLPSGVTASFATNPATSSSMITLTASSTAALGQYNATITGTSGSLTSSTTLTLSIYAPTFTLSDYSSVSIGQGNSATSYVYLNPQYGFTGNVTLAVTGLPAGVTASFSPNPISTSTSSSVLTLTASSTAALGQYNVTITGTSGSTTASTSLSVGVYVSSFTLSDYSSVSIGQGGTATSYVYVNPQYGFAGNVTLAVAGLPSGVTGSFSPSTISTGSSLLTLNASSTAALGQYTAIVTGTSGSTTATTPLTVGVYVPTFTLSDYSSVSINQGASGTSTVNVNPQYGFTGSVTLAASGLPSGVTASFSPNPATGSSVMTLTAANPSTPGTFAVTITGTSGNATASTTLSLTIYPQTFTLSDAPTELTLAQGSSGRSTVYVVPQYGFSGAVSFTASGLPSGVTASFTPNPSTGSSVMTLTATNAATLGLATVTITGTSGALVQTTQLALTVAAAQTTSSTTLTVTSAGAPVTSVAAGSVVTLTAAVSAGSAPLTTGQVRFCDATATYCEDGHLLGTAQLTSAGTAVLKFVPGMGSRSYKAVFAGTQNNAGSSSGAAALAVTAAIASTTTLAQSGAAGNYTLTATVTGQGLLPPTGNVSFQDTSSGNAVVGTAALGQGKTTLNWANPQSPATGTQPEGIATGDFNGDGIPDLAIANQNSNTVTILLGKGDGTFTASSVSPPTGSYPGSIVVADFNGDGKPDLAVGNLNSSTLTILLGNGDGTFTPAASPATGSRPISIAVGDFNRDGIPDLAVANQYSSTVTILLGNGDGTFTQSSSPVTGSYPTSVAVGDFNGDGVSDLAVGNEFSNTVTILLGNGDGTFIANPVSPQTGSDPYFIAVGDFNGDGITDLAVANDGGSTLSILLGNGDGTFTPAASPTTGSEPTSVAAGDFNGDGKVDLAVSNYGGNSVTVLLGNGDGTFTATTQSVGTEPWAIAEGPFNKNGSPGLAVTSVYNSTVSVLTAQLTQTATAIASNVSPLGQGLHLVDASYPGDSSYASSISTTLGLTAQPAAPIVTATLSTSNIKTTQPLTVTVAVNGGSGNPTPTGSVKLTSGSYTSTPATLSNGNATINIAAGLLAPGSDALTVSYTPDSNSSSTYISSTGSSSVTVTLPATPAITWATPAAIPYGTPLSATQLNASSTVAGTFAYTPALGAVLTAGPQTLTATFTPTDTTDYTTATATVILTVNKATPAITWATPAAIIYGTGLSAAQLNAGSTVAGTFAYSPALGAVLTAGPQTLTATFTPTDSTDYAIATATVILSVNKAAPAITWPVPAAIGYGTALSAAQLDATAPTPGVFTYTPAAGTVLALGHQALSVSFAPTDTADYLPATGVNAVQVNPALLTVTAANASRAYGAANPVFSATVAGAVNNDSFTASASSLATPASAAGSYAIVPSVSGANLANYTVSPVDGVLTVTPLPLAVVASNATRSYGAANPTLTGSVTGAINGDTFTVIGSSTATGTSPVGSYPITYTVTGANVANYTVVPATGTLTVTQATPAITWAAPAAITYGTALSAAQLNATAPAAGTFVYSPAAGAVPGAGTQTLSVTFTPTDTTDYAAPGTTTVPLTVNKVALAIAANSTARMYGTANPAFTGTVAGAVNGDTFTESFSTAATAASIVGSYPIVPAVTGANLADYAVTPANGALTITPAGTATTFALSNTNLTLTATVVSLTSGTPTGTVGFYEGQTLVGTGTLTSGVASYTATTFPAGNVTVTAEYSGDANFTQSTSPAIAVLAIAPAQTAITVGPASTASDALSLTVAAGFTGTLTFSCAGLPAEATCSFSPATYTFTGTANTASVMMSVQTGVSAQEAAPALFGPGNGPVTLAGVFGLSGLLALSVGARRRRLRMRLMLLTVALGIASGMVTACGSSPVSPAQSPAGTSTVVVTASGPSGFSQTASVTLTVQ